MSTRVTAAEVTEESWVMHDNHLCHVTEKHDTDTGAVSLGWTEDLDGREAYFQGTFTAATYFGEVATI